MCIDFGALLLFLFVEIEVPEHNLEIILILEEYFALDGLCDAVHSVQAHLLLMLVDSEFVQMLDENSAVLDVVDILAGLILVVCKR